MTPTTGNPAAAAAFKPDGESCNYRVWYHFSISWSTIESISEINLVKKKVLSSAREIGMPPWTFVLAIHYLNIIEEIPISLHDICIVSILHAHSPNQTPNLHHKLTSWYEKDSQARGAYLNSKCVLR